MREVKSLSRQQMIQKAQMNKLQGQFDRQQQVACPPPQVNWPHSATER